MLKVRRVALSSDRYLLNVAGRLASGWAGRFAGRLAERGINIEKATASRDARGFWTAGFEVTRTADGMDPEEVDFSDLLTAEPLAADVEPPRVYGYSLRRLLGEARLVLELEAPDQIGFLSRLLRRLSFFPLFPVEMKIETAGGIVRDTVHLTSVGGSAPSANAVAALCRDLDALLVPAELTGA
jgi:hypothetical protein